MRFRGLVAVALTCIAFVQPVRAADKSDQAKKPKNYAEAAEECEKAIGRRKHELATQYSTDVWGLKDKFQKAGDLEKALVADNEWSRSLSRKPLVKEDLVDTLPELANVQREYIALFTKVAETVATEFLQDLKKESSELAKAGRLADGKVLQQEIDTIKRLYLGGRDGKARGSDVAEGKAEGDVVTACEEAIRQKRVATQAQYVGELEAMEKSFQAKGALEDLFAVKAEQKRFLETPILAEENLMETPDALRELQREYLELQQHVTTSVAEEFIARLEQQKQALTIEGRLDEAVKAKADVQKISQRYMDSARESRTTKRPPSVAGTWNSGGNHFQITQKGGVISWKSQDSQHTYSSNCTWDGTHFVGTCERTIKGSGCTVPIRLVLTLKSPTEVFCEDTAMQTGCGLTRNQQHTSTWQKLK
jgi:hypothetical protein